MSELKRYRYTHTVDADTWAVYVKEDRLEMLVENIGWQAIRAAVNEGVQKIRDVKFFIDPSEREESKTVEVTLLYVSSV